MTTKDKAWLNYWSIANPTSTHVHTHNCRDDKHFDYVLPRDAELAFKAGWEARAKWEAKITIDVLHLDEQGLAGE